jgi:hypothetical protein
MTEIGGRNKALVLKAFHTLRNKSTDKDADEVWDLHVR